VAYARGDERPLATLLDSVLKVGNAAHRLRASVGLAQLMARRGQFRRSATLRAEAIPSLGGSAGLATVGDAVQNVWREAWFLGPSPRHAERLDSLAGSPGFAALAPIDRPYLRLASAYARVGRPDRARAMLARLRAEVPDTATQRARQPAVHGVLGEIALAEGRPLDAVAEFRRGDQAPDGPASQCGECLAANLARAYDAAGNADSTVAAIERYLRAPLAARYFNGTDVTYLAPFTKRLGELYDARGDVARAIVHYREFVALWQDADPELQPTVAEVRRRIARLEAREGRAR
jgi:tetratricopeptide (TPR) repeat protein